MRPTTQSILHHESNNEDLLQQWRKLGQCTNLFVQITIETSTTSWIEQWLWSDFASQFDLTMMFISTIICLDSRVFETMLFLTIWGTVKYNCIYNICDTWGTQLCTMWSLQGPWVKLTERQLPRVQKVLSDIQYNVYKSSWFLQDR